LRRPLGADLASRHAPDLFGVAGEKPFIQTAAEALADPLLKGVGLTLRCQTGPQIAQTCGRAFHHTHISQGVADLKGVGVELLVIENARQTVGEPEILAQHVGPKSLDHRDFCKETVSADIESIALVSLGARDAANHATGLQDERRPSSLDKFMGRRQPGRTGADHDGPRHAALAFSPEITFKERGINAARPAPMTKPTPHKR